MANVFTTTKTGRAGGDDAVCGVCGVGRRKHKCDDCDIDTFEGGNNTKKKEKGPGVNNDDESPLARVLL